jgi:hypothetical protein
VSRLRTTAVRRSRLTPAPGSDCTGTRHGTYSAVRQNGCRCPDGLQDRYRYEKRQTSGRLQPAMVDGTGTTRRLQAMNALGYGCYYLATRLDSDRKYVRRLMDGDKTQVHRTTSAAIKELYRDLVDKPAKWNPDYYPHMTAAEREARIALTARGAERHGYLLPGRWGDGAIDDPQAGPESDGRSGHGQRPNGDAVRELIRMGSPADDIRQTYRAIPAAERAGVVADLTGRGKSTAEIAGLLGISDRTVTRLRGAGSDSAQRPAQTDQAVTVAEVTASAVQAVEEHVAGQDADTAGWYDDQADGDVDVDARGRVDA